MWIHGDLVQGPRTLYPPTTEQFSSLIAFLLAEPDHQPVCLYAPRCQIVLVGILIMPSPSITSSEIGTNA